ncbi:membrane protein%2C yeeR [Escherichia coli]|nr:membrane protein%2C yeeR [Escherichia coli]CTZ26650.1 membrane protein%2C yeeR [Escherichia coli]
MKLPETWSTNEKMFASGGQGHGFAAERGNHIVDRVRLKNARILGDNNARNGADRLVSGTEIQTKYCSTAARSVGAAFDGQNGQYRYMGNNGPMQLEVPRDQYAGAVETMRNKIREGKVPGVTDPAEAVTYDIAEGSVVSLAAGGISFALTASVFWLSTGDRDAALQTAAVQAGKTFTRTLAVYVTTQQLHRLSVVQGMLKHIDFSTASPTVRLALQKGTGAGNISALNKVMKGTLVTSLALVAVTTGPDMIKMLRGRISGTQFIRNLAVASSGVAGGAVGSVAGGILFSPLGPFGALTGRVVGGVLGGMIASAVSGKIAGALVEEDRVKILAMIQEQVTWLAGSFLLTGHEIENLNENLARVIDQNALEIIFAAGIQQRAATNMLIKPLVVSIIRQRPVMEYDASHLGNMVNRLEEALPPELPA